MSREGASRRSRRLLALAWAQIADHGAIMQWIRLVCVLDLFAFHQVDADWYQPTRVRGDTPMTAERALLFIEPYCPKLAAKLRSLTPPLPPAAAATSSTNNRRHPVAPYWWLGQGESAQKGKGT